MIAFATAACGAVLDIPPGGATRIALPIVIGLTVIFTCMQPFERITQARRIGWVVALALLAGTVANLARSRDPIDQSKGYADWERTYFLALDEHFAIPVASVDGGPPLWLMESAATFLNSGGTSARGE